MAMARYPTYGERYWDHDAGCALEVESVDYEICGNENWIAVHCRCSSGPISFIGMAWEQAYFSGQLELMD